MIGVPLLLLAGVFLLHDRKYNFIAMAAAVFSCIPFFLSFERKRARTTELVLIAAMTALSVVGRVIFAPLPGFKPVTAITVITGMHFGPQAGFLTGSLSAIVSNIFFGQGPWTPFQMFVWGIIGYAAGLLQMRTRPGSEMAACLVRVVCRIAFFPDMDIGPC